MEIENIFITHAHYDHLGGLHDVLNLFESFKLKRPKIFKHLDGNQFEKSVFDRYPDLQSQVTNVSNN